MNSNEYRDTESIEIGVVTLVQKSKRCGKANCDKCPHKGYWYARMPTYFVRPNAKHEVYLGKLWTDKSLRELVAPLLIEKREKQFVNVLDLWVAREEVVRRLAQVGELKRSRVALENDYRRRLGMIVDGEKQNAAALKGAQKRVKALGKITANGR